MSHKIQQIEIVFPCPVTIPDGWEQILDALIDMVCKQYEKENPDRVMWPAGHGCKPIWSQRDAGFLGVKPDRDAPLDGEPSWDESTYQISCSEREDTSGTNPHNPNKEKLQEEARQHRKSKKSNREEHF